MLLTIMLGLWATMLAARGTPIGRVLERWLVAKPAAALGRIRRGAVLAVMALAVIGLSCWFVMGHEGVLVYGMALPELSAALAMIDLGVVFDIAVVMVATGSVTGWKAVRTMAALRLPRPRAARARRTLRARKPANDDSEGPAGFALAA